MNKFIFRYQLYAVGLALIFGIFITSAQANQKLSNDEIDALELRVSNSQTISGPSGQNELALLVRQFKSVGWFSFDDTRKIVKLTTQHGESDGQFLMNTEDVVKDGDNYRILALAKKWQPSELDERYYANISLEGEFLPCRQASFGPEMVKNEWGASLHYHEKVALLYPEGPYLNKPRTIMATVSYLAQKEPSLDYDVEFYALVSLYEDERSPFSDLSESYAKECADVPEL